MPTVVSGRIIRTDVTTQSGFTYGLISLDAGNQGRMDVRYDMSSKGPVPTVGTYVTVTCAEGNPPRVMEIRVVESGFTAPSSSSSVPIWSSRSGTEVSSPPPSSSQPLSGFDVSLPEYVKTNPQTGWTARSASTPSSHGIDIVGGARPRSPYEGRYGPYPPAKPNGISVIAAIFLLLGTMGVFFCYMLLLVFPLSGLLAILIDLVLFVTAAGVYNMKEWARLITTILAAFMCLTLVGALVGIPILWYLNQGEIKRQFK